MDISTALSAVKGTLDRVLDKNLQDLVRAIRNHKDDEAKFITTCLEEIKVELRNDSYAVKANAVNKLAYMLGCDISWAAFNIIEVMSSSKFTYKRIGYHCASQSFHDETDVLMLATNMIKKDLNGHKMYDTSTAISGLACFMNEDMARDLHTDIISLMSSSKPYIRKRAVLLMYKVFLRYPEALRSCFLRLREKLDDPDPGVQAAAVNVICELARKNPQHYLSLSPVFFQLMTTSSNNWVLIKIIKLFGALTPFEPRLGKKLIGPLTNLIHNTSAMSLLYECINTVLAGIPNHEASIQLCVQKLRVLIEDSDQNLKYLGLLAMIKILKHHPKSVQSHKDLVLNCLDDRDESIRLRALDLLLNGLTNKKNLTEIIKTLLKHASNTAYGAHYKMELVSKIIQICSQNDYQLVISFEWYISVLVQLAQTPGIKSGKIIAAQLMDVSIRVESVREFATEQMSVLLENCATLANRYKHSALLDILHAASWICGEYAHFLTNPQRTLDGVLSAAALKSLDTQSQPLLLLSALKLYCKHCMVLLQRAEENVCEPQSLLDSLLELSNGLIDKITLFVHSADLEVQERAVWIHQLLSMVVKQLNRVKSGAYVKPRPVGQAVEQVSVLEQRLVELALPEDATASVVELKEEEADKPLMLEPNDEVNELIAGDMIEELTKLESEQTQRSSSTCSNEQTVVSEADSLLNALKPVVLELSMLFAREVNPVTATAQKKVPVPEGLDLDAWINEPPSAKTKDSDSDTPRENKQRKKKKKHREPEEPSNDLFQGLQSKAPVVDLAESERVRLERQKERDNNPHYLKPMTNSPKKAPLNAESSINGHAHKEDKKPTNEEDSVLNLLAKPDQFIPEKLRGSEKEKKRKKKHHRDRSEERDDRVAPVVKKTFDLPEGVVDAPEQDDGMNEEDPHARLNLVLDDLFQEQGIADELMSKEKKRKKKKAPQAIDADRFAEILSEPNNPLTACRITSKYPCPANKSVLDHEEAFKLEDIFVQLLEQARSQIGCQIVDRIQLTASLYAAASQQVFILLKVN
ncbi:AP-3 complex subunit delta-1, partial [Cichlidogyrus casuarinus]